MFFKTFLSRAAQLCILIYYGIGVFKAHEIYKGVENNPFLYIRGTKISLYVRVLIHCLLRRRTC